MMYAGSHPTVAMDLARYRMQEEHTRAAQYRAALEARKAARDARLADEARRPRRIGAFWQALAPRLSH